MHEPGLDLICSSYVILLLELRPFNASHVNLEPWRRAQLQVGRLRQSIAVTRNKAPQYRDENRDGHHGDAKDAPPENGAIRGHKRCGAGPFGCSHQEVAAILLHPPEHPQPKRCAHNFA